MWPVHTDPALCADRVPCSNRIEGLVVFDGAAGKTPFVAAVETSLDRKPKRLKLLLRHHLKRLKLPTVLREHQELGRQCAREDIDHVRYLARLIKLKLLDRDARMIEHRIKAAKVPAAKSLESFDFEVIRSLNKQRVLDLTRAEFIACHENVIALGESGTGKTQIATVIGLTVCQRGTKVRFETAAAIVRDLIEARDDKRLFRLQKTLAPLELPIIDELGFVPRSKPGAELLFELISKRHERGAIIITCDLPFDDSTSILGDERLTGALLDRLIDHVHILEMNGQSYRLALRRDRSLRSLYRSLDGVRRRGATAEYLAHSSSFT